jgi:glutaredoxin
MRSLAIIGLIALAAAVVALARHAPSTAGLLRVPGATSTAAATLAEEAARSEDGPGAAEEAASARPGALVDRFTQDDVEAAEQGRRVVYQFSDASGSVHFVDSIEQVPAAYRERVGRVELGGREKPRRRSRALRPRQTAEASSQPQRRRPFAYAPDPTVVVYTAPWCGWCRKTLAHLDGRGVAYVNKNIEGNPAHRQELLRKTGRSSIPVVEIDGELIRGHDPARIDELLGRAS